MPATPGKLSSAKSSRKKSVLKSNSKVLGRQQILSRERALKRIKKLLTQEENISSETLELIMLFQIQIDELTEIGISYEMARALEQRYPLILS